MQQVPNVKKNILVKNLNVTHLGTLIMLMTSSFIDNNFFSFLLKVGSEEPNRTVTENLKNGGRLVERGLDCQTKLYQYTIFQDDCPSRQETMCLQLSEIVAITI